MDAAVDHTQQNHLINHHVLPLLQRGNWFHALPVDFQHALIANAQLVELLPQQYLFKRHDPFDGIYCVLKGALRIHNHNEAGKEALLALLEPYNWFGEIALIDGLPRTHDVVSDIQSQLLRIKPAALSQILQEKPLYWRYIAQLSTQKLRFALLTLEENALLSAFSRVVSRIILIAEGYGELHHQSRRVLHLSQEQLASMLGISRQTTNQILKQLEASALIRVDYREIEILDLAALKHLSQQH
jgi:CRP/FNR family cyclic AMP-dependent transcriptional regulator